MNWLETKSCSYDYDYIFAADVIWLDALVEPLVSTMRICSKKETVIIIAHQTRSLKTENLFFEMLKKYGFEYSTISNNELNPDFDTLRIRLFRIILEEHE